MSMFPLCYAQRSYDSTKNDLSFAVRGKYLPGFIIEDIYFRTYGLGAEMIFKERHSIGFDANVFRWRFQNDDANDVEMYDEFERRAYLNVDYKLNFMLNDNLGLYLNTIFKFNGKYRSWIEMYDYPEQKEVFSRSAGTFYEPGVGIGIKGYFGDSDFGIDASMNVGRRFEIRDEVNQLYPEGFEYVDNRNLTQNRFYIRLNFFYHFCRWKQ